MTVEEEMAIAVLRGDSAAALALADRLCENRVAGIIQIPAIKELVVASRKLQALVYAPSGTDMTTQDIQHVISEVTLWLDGRERVLWCPNDFRIEVYSLPKVPDGQTPRRNEILGDRSGPFAT